MNNQKQRQQSQQWLRKTRKLCEKAARLVSLVQSGVLSKSRIQNLKVLHFNAESNRQYLIVTLNYLAIDGSFSKPEIG